MNNFDETHLFSFGFLYTLKPTSTPVTGLMCSLPGSVYLEVIPKHNPGKTYIQNDSIENMYYEIQLFIKEPGYYFLTVEKYTSTELFFKSRIEYQGEPMFQYSTVVNPHMKEHGLKDFIQKGRSKFGEGSQ